MPESGSTLAVVYLSSSGPLAAAARFVGNALAFWMPGGAHWSLSASAVGAHTMVAKINAIAAMTDALDDLATPET
jgi:hypothetical protein